MSRITDTEREFINESLKLGLYDFVQNVRAMLKEAMLESWGDKENSYEKGVYDGLEMAYNEVEDYINTSIGKKKYTKMIIEKAKQAKLEQ